MLSSGLGRPVLSRVGPDVVVAPIKHELAPGRLVDQRAHQSPHDGEDSRGADYQNPAIRNDHVKKLPNLLVVASNKAVFPRFFGINDTQQT